MPKKTVDTPVEDTGLISTEALILLDQARSLRPVEAKADASQHDATVHQLESMLAKLEADADEAEQYRRNDPTSARSKADALRREINHVRYVK